VATLRSPLPATAPHFCVVFVDCMVTEQLSVNQGHVHTCVTRWRGGTTAPIATGNQCPNVILLSIGS